MDPEDMHDGAGGTGFEDVDPAVSQSAYEDLAGPEGDDVAEVVNNWSVMDDPGDAFGGGPADAILAGLNEGERGIADEGVEAGLGAYEGDPEGDGDEDEAAGGDGWIDEASEDEADLLTDEDSGEWAYEGWGCDRVEAL